MECPNGNSAADNRLKRSLAQELIARGFTREDIENLVGELRHLLDSEEPKKMVTVNNREESPTTASIEEPEASTSTIARIDTCKEGESSNQRPNMRSGHPPISPRGTTPSPSKTINRTPSSARTIHRVDSSIKASERPASKRSRIFDGTKTNFTQSPSSSLRRRRINLDEAMKIKSRSSRRASESEESEESGDETLQDIFTLRNSFCSSSPIKRHPSSHQNGTKETPGNGRQYYRQGATSSPSMASSNSYYREADERPTTPRMDGRFNSIYQTSSLSRSGRSHYRSHKVIGTNPPSSPAVLSSLASSPGPLSYPLASSPGPMSDLPDQNSEDLPYQLPPGPYSDEKPDHSYAALIGQAILASSNHALRLKDIYDYISIVYPFFKRDGHSHSQKWMNAIRQNLTNTPQFFKKEHPSGKQSKGALWCISDENLPCFADGGYNRHALNPNSSQAEKAEKRKRKREEKQREEKAKRSRIGTNTGYPALGDTPCIVPYYPPNFRLSGSSSVVETKIDSDVIFPPLPDNHPNAHLVSAAASSSGSAVDAGIIFPPLPEYSGTRIARERLEKELAKHTSATTLEDLYSRASSQPLSDNGRTSPASAPPMSSEASSVPELTSNNSSSSPAELSEDTMSHLLEYMNFQQKGQASSQDYLSQESDSLFDEYIDSEAHSDAFSDVQSIHEEEECVGRVDKGKGKAVEISMFPALPPPPASPTATRKSVARSPGTSLYASAGYLWQASSKAPKRVSTPPTDIGRQNPPSTPTPNKRATKSMDDIFGCDEPLNFFNSMPRTPSRRPQDLTGNLPSTPSPKKYSPFNIFSGSPFRTPSRRMLDDSEPGATLKNELDSLAASKRLEIADSPSGFLSRRNLLFESPTLRSPDKWAEIWRAW